MVKAQLSFNEASSINTLFIDEDGDTPDWIELYNNSDDGINLKDWSLTDKIDQPTKWQFGDVDLLSEEYLLIWASGKDRKEISKARNFVKQGDEVKYLLPNQSVSNLWIDIDFDDGDWLIGETGIGYGDGDDETIIDQGASSVFIRQKFSIDDESLVEALFFDLDYDDGFVAYINGVEIARNNIIGNQPSYFQLATENHEAVLYTGGIPERFEVNTDLLNSGDNVLALQIHNVGNSSTDLSAIPFLTAIYSGSTNDGVLPPSLLGFGEGSFHTNFKISSEGETLYLFDNAQILIDSLLVPPLCPDVTIGKALNENKIVYFEEATPGFENTPISFLGIVFEDIEFSQESGIYGPFELSMEVLEDDYEIRYSLDGTTPSMLSTSYQAPLEVRASTIVNAKVFRDNFIPSKTKSKSYLIDINHSLPVVSLVVDPEDFFNEDYGIYSFGDSYDQNYPFFGANFWEEWERAIHFSYFSLNGQLAIEYNAGVKIFGGWSRAQEQKSLSLFARKAYGHDEFEYPFFNNRSYDTFQSLVLRNSGNDWLNTMMRDATLVGLMEGSGLDLQAYQPTVSYLNGEYWGIYNLREKITNHTLAAKHNIDVDSINLLELQGDVIDGDATDYLEFIDFIERSVLANANEYEYVESKIDIENYIMYQLAQIYFDNHDWPGNNYKYWNSNQTKYRWLLFDLDFGFGPWNTQSYFSNTLDFALEPNGPGWPNPSWSTLLFRRLIQNQEFRFRFINQYADELNTRFLPEAVSAHIDNISRAIAPEINQHYQRWGGDIPEWSQQVSNMKTFGRERPFHAKNHLLQKFSLPNYHTIKLYNNDVDKGFIEINSLSILNENWEGDYFESVPIRLKAVPFAGQEFIRWEGDVNTTDEEIFIDMKSEMNLTAVFTEPSSNYEVVNSNELLIYPNPTAGYLFVDLDGKKELYGPLGQRIMVFYDSKIDLSKLSSGKYILKTEDSASVIVKE